MSACFVVLVRNSELDGIASSMKQLESTFNSKFNYDYVFLNDDDFTPEFIETTSSLTNSKTKYGKLDSQMWGYPSFINTTYAAECRAEMQKTGVPYAENEYDYYWRIEPYVDFYCDIDYDVFKYMRDNNKKYVPTLWQTIMNFKKEHPEVVSHWPAKKDSLIKFITDDKEESYNGCHFWTNFEIASLDLWRSNDYLKLFNYLDQSGGFFYERWGDAPVHSIAASMMLRKDEIHFFNDIGYRHTSYTHCPAEPQYRDKCSCKAEDSLDFKEPVSCLAQYMAAHSLKSEASSQCVVTPCGHVYHDGCLTAWISQSPICPICKAKTRPSQLKNVYLTKSNISDHRSFIEDVLYQGGPLKASIDTLKKQLETHKMEAKPVIDDLEYFKDATENNLDYFGDLKDRNKNLEREIEHELKGLNKSFDTKRIERNYTTTRRLTVEAQAELENMINSFDQQVRQWKEQLNNKLAHVKTKDELIIKLGDEPRTYIKDSFEKSAKRLYQCDF
ncbi:hypothetical protein G6F56_003468 [Rhizopus delemar]|nr:hypothetical protein G6F56_003468 [Rhizopus delemar]